MRETKEVVFPVWRDARPYWFMRKDFTSAVAMWAIRQSPYGMPDYFPETLGEFQAALESFVPFDENEMVQMTGEDVETAVLTAFEKSPRVQAWNRPRSGHNAPFVAVSRYGGPSPDDDFIDLHALARNVKHTLLLERSYERDD